MRMCWAGVLPEGLAFDQNNKHVVELLGEPDSKATPRSCLSRACPRVLISSALRLRASPPRVRTKIPFLAACSPSRSFALETFLKGHCFRI